MNILKQFSRIQHHTLTNGELQFTVPPNEDFTSGSWSSTDLVRSEFGINEANKTVSVRIADEIILIGGSGSTPGLQNVLNIGNTYSGQIEIIDQGSITHQNEFTFGGINIGAGVFGPEDEVSLINTSINPDNSEDISFIRSGVGNLLETSMTQSSASFGAVLIPEEGEPTLLNIMVLKYNQSINTLLNTDAIYNKSIRSDDVYSNIDGYTNSGTSSYESTQHIITNVGTDFGSASYVYTEAITPYSKNTLLQLWEGFYDPEELNTGLTSSSSILQTNKLVAFTIGADTQLDIKEDFITIGENVILKNEDNNNYLKSNKLVEKIGKVNVGLSASVIEPSISSDTIIFLTAQEYTTGTLSVEKNIGVGFIINHTGYSATVSVAYKIID